MHLTLEYWWKICIAICGSKEMGEGHLKFPVENELGHFFFLIYNNYVLICSIRDFGEKRFFIIFENIE